jgi:hypothetical protein
LRNFPLWASNLATSIEGAEFVFGVGRFQRFDDSLSAGLKQWRSIMSKVWLVTGSASGLGRNITEAVLASGARLMATARDPRQLDDVVKEYGDQVRTALFDVADENAANSAVQAAVDAFGRLDVVVNNAGYGDIVLRLPFAIVVMKQCVGTRPTPPQFPGLGHPFRPGDSRPTSGNVRIAQLPWPTSTLEFGSKPLL